MPIKVFERGSVTAKVLVIGLIVLGLMSLVYALLFMLVLSESYSLLMGAITLFGVLATVMIATRKLPWA